MESISKSFAQKWRAKKYASHLRRLGMLDVQIWELPDDRTGKNKFIVICSSKQQSNI